MKHRFFSFFIILLWFFGAFFVPNSIHAQDSNTSVSELHLTDKTIKTNIHNDERRTFYKAFENYFFTADQNITAENIFVKIAFGIKQAFIILAVIFLIIGVLKLLFSDASDAEVKKWRYNIVWVTAGIFVMQITYSVWSILFVRTTSNAIPSSVAWNLWTSIADPIIGILQFLASFAFLAMMIYAFYKIITGAGDEQNFEKWKTTLIYAVIGFLLIQIPNKIISLFYKDKNCTGWSGFTHSSESCKIDVVVKQNEAVKLMIDILDYFNTFLTIFCIIMVLYAGFLLLTSGGEEDRLKTAKNILLYITIGFIILIGSHAIIQTFLVPQITS